MKPRRTWIAVLLALLYPGLGHLYAGHPFWALTLLSAPFFMQVVLLSLAVLGPTHVFLLVMSVPVAYGFFEIAQLISAGMFAKRQPKDYRLAAYNRWFIYLAFLVAVGLGQEFVRKLVRQRLIEPFRIPTVSMVPALIVGDHVLVVKIGPAAKWSRGDIVVFRVPNEELLDTPATYVKRVIAVGGDTVEIRDHGIVVNRQAYTQTRCSPTKYMYAVPGAHGQQTRLRTGDCFLETTPWGKSYTVIYEAALDGRRGSLPPVIIEPNHVYVLSDNRDALNDSRHFGAVAKDRVIGRPVVIWISITSEGIHWERIGKVL